MALMTKLLVHLAWLGDILFIARYSRVRWRATPAGVNVMAFMVVMAAATSLAVLAIWWPRMPGWPTLGLLIWAGIALVIWHRVWVFERGQREGRRASRDNHSARVETGEHGNPP